MLWIKIELASCKAILTSVLYFWVPSNCNFLFHNIPTVWIHFMPLCMYVNSLCLITFCENIRKRSKEFYQKYLYTYKLESTFYHIASYIVFYISITSSHSDEYFTMCYCKMCIKENDANLFSVVFCKL